MRPDTRLTDDDNVLRSILRGRSQPARLNSLVFYTDTTLCLHVKNERLILHEIAQYPSISFLSIVFTSDILFTKIHCPFTLIFYIYHIP